MAHCSISIETHTKFDFKLIFPTIERRQFTDDHHIITDLRTKITHTISQNYCQHPYFSSIYGYKFCYFIGYETRQTRITLF